MEKSNFPRLRAKIKSRAKTILARQRNDFIEGFSDADNEIQINVSELWLWLAQNPFSFKDAVFLKLTEEVVTKWMPSLDVNYSVDSLQGFDEPGLAYIMAEGLQLIDGRHRACVLGTLNKDAWMPIIIIDQAVIDRFTLPMPSWYCAQIKAEIADACEMLKKA